MWAYGHHFCTEDVNDVCVTLYCGVEFMFYQSNHASHHDRNLIVGMLSYVRKIQEIIQVDISSFQCVIFRFKWRDTFDKSNVKEYRDSGLLCINYRDMWDEIKEPYVFPKHYNQVLFHPDVLDRDWWFIIVHDPISRHV